MRWLWTILLLAACSKPGPAGGPANPCSPAGLKLPTARPLTAWALPAGCTVLGGPNATVLVRTEAEAAAIIECSGGALGVDFATTGLVVSRRMLSPATTGVDALDDGTTITFVSRFRSPCPDDPRPMPVPATMVYQVTGHRAFAETTCTMPSACN